MHGVKEDINRVTTYQELILTLVYPWYSNVEHHRRKEKINSIVHSTFNILYTQYTCDVKKKEYTNVFRQLETNSMWKGGQSDKRLIWWGKSKLALLFPDRVENNVSLVQRRGAKRSWQWVSQDKADNYLLYPSTCKNLVITFF